MADRPTSEEQRNHAEKMIKQMAARFSGEEFTNTANPLAGIYAFIDSREGGIDPPETVLQWLDDGFREHLKTGRSLDKILGLNAPCGPAGTPADQNRKRAQKFGLMVEIDDLIMRIGVTPYYGCGMVAGRLADPSLRDENDPWYRYPYSQDSLYEEWKKHQRGQTDPIWYSSEVAHGLIEGIPADGDLLKRYPRYTWPKEI